MLLAEYKSLVKDILSAPEYKLQLKMFASDLSQTLDAKGAKWMFVKPLGITIQMPDEDSDIKELFVYVGKDIYQKNLITAILQRLKKASMPYGILVSIRNFAKNTDSKEVFKNVLSDNLEK